MNPRETRLLFVGDMHLGTRLSRVPEEAGRAEDLGPAAAWRRTVDAAEEHAVHAVILAGDVVNRRNEIFEARRPLEAGLARLADAGIPVLAVAGNHDTDTLPALAVRDRRLELLGPGGTWTARRIAAADGPPVRVIGWSFPQPRWDASPLLAPSPPRGDEVAFGVLHADLDAAASPYAPVATAELRACGYDGWFLGHVHTPEPVPDDDTPFYLGSLTGLDPTETGCHGPVLVRVGTDGTIARERLPLAPLVWAETTLACGRLTRPDDLPALLEAGLTSWLESNDTGRADAVGLRVTLVGAVDDPLGLRDAVRSLDPAGLVTQAEGRTIFVDRLDAAVHAPLDLAARARDGDPVGLLARRALVLSGELEDPELLARLLAESGAAAAAAVDDLAACRALERPSPDAHRAALARAARRLLDRMLADREGAA